MMNEEHNQEALFEISRTEKIERMGRPFKDTGEFKKTTQYDYERDGALHQQIIEEYSQLSCGHVAKISAICICGRTFCEQCTNMQGQALCESCAHYISSCCKVRSKADPSIVYCYPCWKANLLYKVLRKTILGALLILVTVGLWWFIR